MGRAERATITPPRRAWHTIFSLRPSVHDLRTRLYGTPGGLRTQIWNFRSKNCSSNQGSFHRETAMYVLQQLLRQTDGRAICIHHIIYTVKRTPGSSSQEHYGHASRQPPASAPTPEKHAITLSSTRLLTPDIAGVQRHDAAILMSPSQRELRAKARPARPAAAAAPRAPDQSSTTPTKMERKQQQQLYESMSLSWPPTDPHGPPRG